MGRVCSLPGLKEKMGQHIYKSSNGNIQVKNATGYFDKKKEQVVMSCEAKVNEPDGSLSYFTIHSSGLENFCTPPATDGKWHSCKRGFPIGKDGDTAPTWALINQGEQTFSIIVHASIVYTEGEYVKVDIAMDIDLDPVEYHLTFLNDDFGSDSTPDIEWSLTDLGQETFMNKPTLTVTSSGSYVLNLTVGFDDGDGSTTDVVIGTGGIVNLNGIAMSDCTVPFSNTKTYFKRIDSYKLTSPTMVEGLNNFTIDLQCEVI